MSSAVELLGGEPIRQTPEVRPYLKEDGLLRTCCGSVIFPRLAQIRDTSGYGDTVFVTVWRCATCRRVTF